MPTLLPPLLFPVDAVVDDAVDDDTEDDVDEGGGGTNNRAVPLIHCGSVYVSISSVNVAFSS